jgi:hypothetical protein
MRRRYVQILLAAMLSTLPVLIPTVACRAGSPTPEQQRRAERVADIQARCGQASEQSFYAEWGPPDVIQERSDGRWHLWERPDRRGSVVWRLQFDEGGILRDVRASFFAATVDYTHIPW